MATYDYSIVGGLFPNDLLDESSLHSTLENEAQLGGKFSFLGRSGDPAICTIVTDEELTAGEKTTLDSLISEHGGSPISNVTFHASSKLVNKAIEITEPGPGWEELGGTVTTPSFFTKKLNNCKGRIVGQYKTEGSGATLCLLEDGVESGQFELSDTEGSWAKMQWFSANPPTEGTHTYSIAAKLNGATSAFIRFSAISLLEFS